MKTIKIKLTFDEIQAINHTLSTVTAQQILRAATIQEKATWILLFEWFVKRIKPKTYFRYNDRKTISLPLSVACALTFYYQHHHINDVYANNVWRTLINTIHPQIPQL